MQEGAPPLAELVEVGQKALLLVGGRGGRGNQSFKTHKNTAPAMAEKGEAGQEVYLDLELKVRGVEGVRGVGEVPVYWGEGEVAWRSGPAFGGMRYVKQHGNNCILAGRGWLSYRAVRK